jgi:hypothetical protein
MRWSSTKRAQNNKSCQIIQIHSYRISLERMDSEGLNLDISLKSEEEKPERMRDVRLVGVILSH